MITAITNQKGGVGKTTTAINLGAALAAAGKRVLLIDADAGDLTVSLGIDIEDGDTTLFEVLAENVPVKEAIRTVTNDLTGTTYDVLPSDGAMRNLDATVGDTIEPQTLLRRALAPIETAYDYILLDTAPSVTMATINALVAADNLLIPALPHFLSVQALDTLMGTVQEVKDSFNPALSVLGVLITNYNARSTHHQDVVNAIKTAFPDDVLATAVSSSVAVTEASANGKDLFEYAAMNSARRHARPLEQYKDAVKELLAKETVNG